MKSWTHVVLLSGLLLAGALAGCSSKNTPAAASGGVDCTNAQFKSDPACQTPTSVDPHKGAIRCVVTDTAIHPVPNAVVKVKGNGKVVATTNTTAAGLCAVNGLDAGSYFLEVSKRGYTTTQTNVEVQAGVVPGFTKIILQADPSSLPYFEVYDFKGHIECGASAIYISGAVCGIAGDQTNDQFLASYTPSGNITFAQSELVWTSTQASGDHLSLDYSVGSLEPASFASNVSASPVIVKANYTLLHKWVNGSADPLDVRVFSGGVQGTNPGEFPDPTAQDPCAIPATPVTSGGCVCGDPGSSSCQVSGAGTTVDQTFDIYTVLFYGFRPPADYTFGKDGAPNIPSV